MKSAFFILLSILYLAAGRTANVPASDSFPAGAAQTCSAKYKNFPGKPLDESCPVAYNRARCKSV